MVTAEIAGCSIIAHPASQSDKYWTSDSCARKARRLTRKRRAVSTMYVTGSARIDSDKKKEERERKRDTTAPRHMLLSTVDFGNS